MAFSIELTGVKIYQGKYKMINVPGVFPDYLGGVDESRFTQTTTSFSYLDSFAILTTDEALTLSSRYCHILEAAYEEEDTDDCPSLVSLIKEAISQSNFVIARRYEWESGMG